ncbi:MAG: DUF2780 domain-containing protein [Nitrospira sp.]|nr:MAG: DUF2780 domain-containing protein [Nitrospira sp.]
MHCAISSNKRGGSIVKYLSFVTATLFLSVFGLSGCASLPLMNPQDVLTSMVAKQHGIGPSQGKAAVGSILNYAKEKMPAADFSTLSNSLPALGTYLKEATDVKAVTGPIVDQAGLESAFAKVALGPKMVPRITKTMSDFVGTSGGEMARNFFASLMN